MSQGRVERRLAAIVAVDVAGYSRLMGVDDEGTLAALQTIRRDLSDPKIKEHRGRIVKTTGDGLLVEFASVVDALRCAVEVQQAMAERNIDKPAGTAILRSPMPRCTSTAQRTASTTLGNSASSPSPVVLTMRPPRSAIFGSSSSRRCALSRARVPSSSAPINRE